MNSNDYASHARLALALNVRTGLSSRAHDQQVNSGHVEQAIAVMRDLGWHVKEPEPQFYVLHSGLKWTVMERGKRLVADFYGGEAAGEHAREHADRLNREVAL